MMQVQKKKALMLASVASMIDLFNRDNINILTELNYDVDVAANFQSGSITSQEQVDRFKLELINRGIKAIHIPIPRSMYKLKEIISSYIMVKKLVEKKNYDIVHCHSPIGGVICRLAANKLRKNGLRVIYTAHGFHFFKGAPLKNWLFYYPVEKYLSRYTDILITINQEDYERAKRKFKAKKIEYVPGVGIDINKFQNVAVDKEKKRVELGIAKEAYVMLSVGELNENKNHSTVIRALKRVNNPNITYMICGQGPLEEKLKDLIKGLDLSSQVKLLGYRSDIPEILKVSDLFVFPSHREGLGLAAIEAMASGLPIITSNIHGIKDYSIDGVTGYSCSPNDFKGFASAIKKIISNQEKTKDFVRYNKERVIEFSDDRVLERMDTIYNSL